MVGRTIHDNDITTNIYRENISTGNISKIGKLHLWNLDGKFALQLRGKQCGMNYPFKLVKAFNILKVSFSLSATDQYQRFHYQADKLSG